MVLTTALNIEDASTVEPAVCVADLAIVLFSDIAGDAQSAEYEVQAVGLELGISIAVIHVASSVEAYGTALQAALAEAGGSRYVMTLDTELANASRLLKDFWGRRQTADVLVASRYVTGGRAAMPLWRRALSRLLNGFYRRVLSVPIRDLTSGYRFYRGGALRSISVTNRDFAILPELVVRLYAEGYRIAESPFTFATRTGRQPLWRMVRLVRSYAATVFGLWRLRNSIDSADYDGRAFNSVIPLQRYWQRHRHRIVLKFTGVGGRILDVGCGSSRILRDLKGAIGVDVLIRKLRFMKSVDCRVARASVFALPFHDEAFDTVICSEVIEHIPDDPVVLAELGRVLKPGGTLVLGTPDYGRTLWHVIEWLYGRVASGGYAHEHITHFDRRGLADRLTALGYHTLECRYVGACEMIFRCTKPVDPALVR